MKLARVPVAVFGTGETAKCFLKNAPFKIDYLFDADESSIGKKFFGLVVSDYRKYASLTNQIVLACNPINYGLIQQRLAPYSSAKTQYLSVSLDRIPRVEKATKILFNSSGAPPQSLVGLLGKIELENYEVVSFDLFDTLVGRYLGNPNDLFSTLPGGRGRAAARKRVGSEFADKKPLPEIWRAIYLNDDCNYDSYSEEEAEELRVLYPIDSVITFLKRVSEIKTVIVVTDTPHRSAFVETILRRFGIADHVNKIYVSSTFGATKADGELWKIVANDFITKRILHIGDNLASDVIKPKTFSIESFYLGHVDWLESSFSNVSLLDARQTRADHYAYGLLKADLRGDVENGMTKTKPFLVARHEDYGYRVLGYILFKYLRWINRYAKKKVGHSIHFVSRDGYFLKFLYDKFFYEPCLKSQTTYLLSSRNLINFIRLRDSVDIDALIRVPFKGTISDLMQYRFLLHPTIKNNRLVDTSSEEGFDAAKSYLAHYYEDIIRSSRIAHTRYRRYLEGCAVNDGDLFVDPSFRGTNQWGVEQTLGCKLVGLYMNANLSPQNPYGQQIQRMFALYQEKNDPTGLNSSIRKHHALIEDGFLVAPHGNLREFNAQGSPIFYEGVTTQNLFSDKILIRKGVERFIADLLALELNSSSDSDIENINYIETFASIAFGAEDLISDEIKPSFFRDSNFNSVYDVSIF